MEKEIALVYMVAGMSSRFGGKVKQFAKVGPQDETLIECSLKQALPAGFTKIIFIVGNKTEKIFKEKFRDECYGVPVYYALQSFDENIRIKPWGTTDALCSAKYLLDCPFVLCNGDDLYGKNSFKILVDHLKTSEDSAAIGFDLNKVLPENGKTNRGIFQVDKNNYITGLKEFIGIEKSDLGKTFSKDTLCSMNIFALQPKVFEQLVPILEQFKEENKENREIEVLLPEDLSNLIKENNLSMKLYSTPDSWIGVTNPEDEEIVREQLKNLN